MLAYEVRFASIGFPGGSSNWRLEEDWQHPGQLRLTYELNGFAAWAELRYVQFQFEREPDVDPGSLAEGILIVCAVQQGKKYEEPYTTLARWSKWELRMHMAELVDTVQFQGEHYDPPTTSERTEAGKQRTS